MLELADHVLLVGCCSAGPDHLMMVMNLVIAVERSDRTDAYVLDAAGVHHLGLLLALFGVYCSLEVTRHMHDVLVARIVLLAHPHAIIGLTLPLRNLSIGSILSILILSVCTKHLDSIGLRARAFF